MATNIDSVFKHRSFPSDAPSTNTISASAGNIITHLGITYTGNVNKCFAFLNSFPSDLFTLNIQIVFDNNTTCEAKLGKTGVLQIHNTAITTITFQSIDESFEWDKLFVEYLEKPQQGS